MKNDQIMVAVVDCSRGSRGGILQRQVVRSRDRNFGNPKPNFKNVIDSGAENDEESESITDFEKY